MWLGTAAWRWSVALQNDEAGQLRASGLLEATEVRLSSELGGRLKTRLVREGEPVRDDQVVAVLDTELVDHQIATAADTATRLHLERQRLRQTHRSPINGWVVRTVFEPGEQIPPGAPVIVVADWRELTMKVYLPEDRFGWVTVGPPAIVAVDSSPGERFTGVVVFIAAQAEFTPRNIQTRDDRVKSVYAIKLRVPNDHLRLKPGSFADATFRLRMSGLNLSATPNSAH